MGRFALLLALLLFSLVNQTATSDNVRAAGGLSSSASAVWGQPDFVSRQCHRPSTLTLCAPAQAVIDAHGNLWVADFDNNRVLMYAPGKATASKVLGQYGSFSSKGCNRQPPHGSRLPAAPNRYTLCEPFGVAVDGAGTLYVADSINNRVLVYFHAGQKSLAAPADLVLGQSNFSATASNDVPAGGARAYRCQSPAPASRCSLSSPMELSLDPQGDLLVPDVDNNRVLLWNAATLTHFAAHPCTRRCFIPASKVWGQYGSFSRGLANNPHIPAGSSSRCTPINASTPASACTLSGPSAAIADGHGDLFVADTANNRVLEYEQALTTTRQDADVVYGQGGDFRSRSVNRDGVSASSFWHPLGLAFDPTGDLWVTDFDNMRVLQFPLPGSNQDTLASQVIGQQGDFGTNGCGISATTVCGPTSISFDQSGHAFITDGLNSRVLEFS